MEKTLNTNIMFVPYKKTGLKSNIAAAMPLLLFFLFNVLKVTVVNFHMMFLQTAGTFLYKFAFTLMVTSIFLLIFKLKRPYLLILAYLLQTLYLFVNLAYFLYFHSNLHIFHSAVLLVEGTKAADNLAIPANPWLLTVFIDLPALIYLLFNYTRMVNLSSKLRFHRNVLITSCILLTIVLESWNYASGYSLMQFTKGYATDESLIVERYGTLVNSTVDLLVNNNDTSLMSHLKYGKELLSTGRKSQKPNFVIIQVESMDASSVNLMHDGKYVMPFLHSLAANNVYYPYTMSYHEAGATSDSEFSTINSVEPLDNYPSMKISNYSYPNSMLKVLDENSFSTVAFHGNVGSYFNRSVAYPKMGFQSFYDMKKMGLHDVIWGAPDQDVFAFSLKKLETLKKPFLSYTVTMSSHGNFTLINGFYNNKAFDDVSDKETRNYMNCMSYVDEQLKTYVTKVQSEFKNTYVFIWGDHTPGFGTDINTFKMTSMNYQGKYFEFVPMVIVTPDHQVYQENSKVASFLDVSPTLLHASGVPYSIRSDGMDLLNPNAQLNPIPFKGGSFDRVDLYQKIAATRN